jgi:hypothetical protein
MIRHERVGMDEDTMADRCFAQQLQIKAEVAFVEKARAAIIPALNDVQREIGQLISRTSGHRGSSIFAASSALYQPLV